MSVIGPEVFWRRLTDEQLQGAEYALKLVRQYLRVGAEDHGALMEELVEEVEAAKAKRPALRPSHLSSSKVKRSAG